MDSVFFDLSVPTPATWFYFALLLAVALFFQFGRLLALRNFDLLALFAFVPGFLLVFDANQNAPRELELFFGYLWLLVASGYWGVRCLLDLTITRRPVLRSNLNLVGTAWFGVALYLCLCGVAARRPVETPVGKPSAAVAGVKDGAAAVVAQTQPTDDPAAAREWGERGLSMACHLAVVLGLLFIGIFQYREADTGVAMGTLYLLLPFTAFHFGQIHHVLPAALTVWAVYAFRRPWLSGLLLGLAAGSSLFPVVLFPAWLHFYWKRGAGRFAATFALALAGGLAVTVLVLWAAGVTSAGLVKALHLADWQPWKPPAAESIWTAVHWAYRLPVFIVFVTFAVIAFVWPPVRNVGHLVAVSAALLIGLQFWYADRGGQYVLWYAPLLILMAFRPSAADLEPPPTGPGGWGRRAAAAVWRRVGLGGSAVPATAA